MPARGSGQDPTLQGLGWGLTAWLGSEEPPSGKHWDGGSAPTAQPGKALYPSQSPAQGWEGVSAKPGLTVWCPKPPDHGIDAFPVSPGARGAARDPADHPAPPAGRPAGLGGHARHPVGIGGAPGRRLARPRCKQENGRMKIAQGRKPRYPGCELHSPTTHPAPLTAAARSSGGPGALLPRQRPPSPVPGCCDAGVWHGVGTHRHAAPHPAASPGRRRSGRHLPAAGRCPRGR